MKRSRIIGMGHYVPERVVSNHDLEKLMDTNDTWIQERTGIQERRHVIRFHEKFINHFNIFFFNISSKSFTLTCFVVCALASQLKSCPYLGENCEGHHGKKGNRGIMIFSLRLYECASKFSSLANGKNNPRRWWLIE